MSDIENKFNRAAVQLQLEEAKLALETALDKTRAGDYDGESPLVIAIDFEQIIYKLCLAWHFKDMTPDEVAALSKDDFIRLSNTVPNFGFQMELMPGIQSTETKRKGNKS